MNSLATIDQGSAIEIDLDLARPVAVYSLGGCMVRNVAMDAAGDVMYFVRHFWRRPTIALMSDPMLSLSFDDSNLPVEFRKYFKEDVSKAHRDKLRNVERGSVLILEITRDIHTGVLKLQHNCYILNPLDAINMMDGINDDTMSRDILEKIIGNSFHTLSYVETPDEFLTIWKQYFYHKIVYLKSIFDRVIILELYFTSKMLSGEHHDSLVGYAHDANIVLNRMYDFARRFDVEFVSIDREFFQTGWNVPWGGPAATHYAQETISLLAQGIREIVTPGHVGNDRALKRQAFRRAGDYELSQSALMGMTEEARTAREEAEAAVAREAQAAHEAVTAREEAEAAVAREAQAAHEAVTAREDAAAAAARAAEATEDARIAREEAEAARVRAAQIADESLRLDDELAVARHQLDALQAEADTLRSRLDEVSLALVPPVSERPAAAAGVLRRTSKRVRAWCRKRLRR